MWMSPRGVAPERMPKADATGLAPKKASVTDPPRSAAKPVTEGSAFHDPKQTPTLFGEVSEERRPWARKRENRRAAFARRSF